MILSEMKAREPGPKFLSLLSLLAVSAVLLAARAPARPQEVVDPEITAGEIMEHIKFLASDELEGREAGSPGAVVAGEYVAEFFKRIGLEPAGDDGTYYQNFSIPRGFKALPTTSVVRERKGRSAAFAFGGEITVMPSSAPGRAAGKALFAGYGISAPMYGYDDYDGVDAKGRIVIVIRGVPGGSRGPFKSREAIRNHGTFKAKQDTAAGLGAAALILVNDPENHGSRKTDVLVSGGNDPRGAIPFIHMTLKAGKRLLSGTGISLGQVQSRIDKTKKPASKELDGLSIEVVAGIEPIELEVRNVLGLLRAAAPDKKDEAVVVGAHFDHIGLGRFGSRGGPKAVGKIHNGADDNASGTAAVIEIAENLAPFREDLKRDVLFASFTAEEMGLLGSRHYVTSPAVPLDRTAAMVNLDMVGRLGRDRLDIGGVGTSPVFEDLIRGANGGLRLKLSFQRGGRAPTDSSSFYGREIPVLFFNTGLHKDYHTPADDWKLIDGRGEAKVALLAARVALALATLDERPPFTRADSSGFRSGPYLGLSIVQKPDGVYVIYVEKRSPASKAGFRAGDKVLEFAGHPIRGTADFYSLKSQCPPGKRISITVRRQGRTRKMKVLLGK